MSEDLAHIGAERTLRRIWIWGGSVVGVFLAAFTLTTTIKAVCAPGDISAGWFAAWGAWTGGVATTVAFSIAAGSILVSSAHARDDRHAAASVLEAEAMAQARLLTVYRVDVPKQPRSYVFFRIENRSNDRFFDVTVDSVDRVLGGERTPLLPPDPTSSTVTMELLPEGELLTPFRSQTDHEAWFTEVRVYTDDWQSVAFAVRYTDAAGRPWIQGTDGTIRRAQTSTSVQVRPADRFQPPSQLRVLTPEEAEEFRRDLSEGGRGES